MDTSMLATGSETTISSLSFHKPTLTLTHTPTLTHTHTQVPLLVSTPCGINLVVPALSSPSRLLCCCFGLLVLLAPLPKTKYTFVNQLPCSSCTSYGHAHTLTLTHAHTHSHTHTHTHTQSLFSFFFAPHQLQGMFVRPNCWRFAGVVANFLLFHLDPPPLAVHSLSWLACR